MPLTSLRSTNAFIAACMRSSRSDEMPTVAGATGAARATGATGVWAVVARLASKTSANAPRPVLIASIGYLPFEGGIIILAMTSPSPVDSVLHAIGHTPVLRLRKVVTPGSADVYVKLEYFNPTGSYKDRMALAMIEGAEKRGTLRQGMRVIEYTGG